MKARAGSSTTIFIGSKVNVLDVAVEIVRETRRALVVHLDGRFHIRECFNQILPVLAYGRRLVEWTDEVED